MLFKWAAIIFIFVEKSTFEKWKSNIFKKSENLVQKFRKKPLFLFLLHWLFIPKHIQKYIVILIKIWICYWNISLWNAAERSCNWPQLRLNQAAAETSCDWLELQLKRAATDSSCGWMVIPCQMIQYFWMLTPLLIRFSSYFHHF